VDARKSDSPFDISNVTDIDNEDEVIDDNQIEKSLNKECDDNKLMQNKNEFDFTAPLQVAEDSSGSKNVGGRSTQSPPPLGIPQSRSNNSIAGSNANSLTNGQRGVKFLSDYGMQQQKHHALGKDEAAEPLLRSESNPSRFKVTTVQDKKAFFKPQPSLPEAPTYWIKENGSLITDKEDGDKTEEDDHVNDESSSERHSKPGTVQALLTLFFSANLNRRMEIQTKNLKKLKFRKSKRKLEFVLN
jgi:hypothetical protein